ncbi:PREDICTED: E3 ubiquitin-protein ligase RNF14-like isoform X1 [Camelina sativa]|uniref:RBR-type E3 ubiquitin transferase n=1 Tax=Camelina sativa TaxID=90675 RepID=A0ABM0VTX5_CAMSA|nr:PREDICTED: E3 ubiquitin-protein ligase RNF14-like isoform X1 [Camelina sativa]
MRRAHGGSGGRNHDRRYVRRGGGIANPVKDQSELDHKQEDTTSTDRSTSPSTSQPLQNLDHTTKPSKPHRSPRSRRGRVSNSKPRPVEVSFTESDVVDCLADDLSSLKVKQNPNSIKDEKIHLSSVDHSNCEESDVNRGESEELADANEYETNEDIMLTILNDLRSSVSEPELTEEQLKMNDQLQEDEILALGYIYGGNMFIFDRHKDMRYFQVHVNVEATNEYTISTKLNLQADSSKESEDFLYSFKAQHLPPIVLTCLLPSAYPSHLPPYFLISVQWMNPDKISSLCSMLDSIWSEQPGQEVLYQWMDWLQNSSISHLGFDDEIVLGPYGVTCSRDKRAVSGSRSPDSDIPYIRSYDDEKRHDSFLQSLHECCICFSESAGIDFVKLPCEHFFCMKCMKTYTDIHVSEGTVNKLKCPDSKCGEVVPPGILKRLLGDEAFERWETLMLQKTLESMTDVAYCPRCETPCIEDEEQLALCFKCHFSFCTLCKEKRHVGVACMSPELRLQILQERQSSSRLGEEQRRKEKEMINEIMSVKVIMKCAKQCPSCKIAISRTGGCNKMVCNNCGQYFCYRCNKAISGYEHFREGTCDLFPQEEMQEWNERMNERQFVGQIQAQMYAQNGQFPQRGQLCPNCRQFNAKAGNNNHLFCWACQAHFCYLCKKVVKKSVQHYGPKGCKQHTDG